MTHGHLLPKQMVGVPSGGFVMGSDDHYPEERPAHREVVVAVDGGGAHSGVFVVKQIAKDAAEIGIASLKPVVPNS